MGQLVRVYLEGTPKARLVVPVGSKNAYASKENWKEFREIVEENPAPVTKCNVTLQEIQGVKITALTEGTEFEPGTSYKFTVETDDTFGDATMEVYANNTRLTADASGVYTVSVKENTFIYTRFKQLPRLPTAVPHGKSPHRRVVWVCAPTL